MKKTSAFSATLQQINVLDHMSSNTLIVKVTGFRLFCTVLPLGLTMGKYSLSAGNDSVASNNLDLVGFVIGSISYASLEIPRANIQKNSILIPSSRLVWIGYYSESHESPTPWFFRDNYSRLLSSLPRG